MIGGDTAWMFPGRALPGWMERGETRGIQRTIANSCQGCVYIVFPFVPTKLFSMNCLRKKARDGKEKQEGEDEERIKLDEKGRS